MSSAVVCHFAFCRSSFFQTSNIEKWDLSWIKPSPFCSFDIRCTFASSASDMKNPFFTNLGLGKMLHRRLQSSKGKQKQIFYAYKKQASVKKTSTNSMACRCDNQTYMKQLTHDGRFLEKFHLSRCSSPMAYKRIFSKNIQALTDRFLFVV